MIFSTRRWIPVALCAVVLTAMFVLQVGTARQESQTIDEAVHLSAGLSYWRTGDFRLNPEHPPLIKMLAAVPLLFTQVVLPTNDATWRTWDQYAFGEVFLYQNILPPQTILLLGRLPIMLLSVLLGIWIFRASRDMFGDWGGVLSVTLYALEPGFIAHGHYITTDLGFTAFAFLAVVRLAKLLDQPTRKNWWWFGLALFIAGLSKFSALAWLGAILITMILLKFREPRHSVLQFKWLLKKILILLPFLALITWAIYGFDIRRRADDPRVTLLYAQRADYLANRPRPTSWAEKFAFDLGDHSSRLGKLVDSTADWPIPGYAFFRGAITVVGHSIGGQGSYLLGQFGEKGWWYYFPVAFITKTSPPVLVTFFALFSLVTTYLIRQRRIKKSWREIYTVVDRRWFILTAVPTIFFATSLLSHLNLGWRHIMPVYPFLFVLAGALTSPKIFPQKTLRIIVPLMLGLGMLIVQAKTYPNEIGYFNVFAGGSENGRNILLDSNLDWGQDLPKLASYMNQNNLSSIPFAYFGKADIPTFISTTPLPTDDDIAAGQIVHGPVAISIGRLHSPKNEFTWLRRLTPTARIGSSIYFYRLP